MKRSHAFLVASAALAALGVAVWLLGSAGTPTSDDGTGGALPSTTSEPRLVGRAGLRDDPTGRRITGRVVDAEDRPQAGVRVEVVAGERRLGTTSDEEGGFALLVPEGVEEATHAARPIAPRVGTARRIALDPRYPTWYRLRVWAGRRLGLRVVDANGAGLRADVAASRTGVSNRGTAAWSRKATTDAEGRLTLLLPPGLIQLTASVPEAGTIRRTLPPPLPDEQVLSFGHADGETLAGVVHDTAERPIGGARVEVRVVLGAGGRLTRVTKTDAAGRWELPGLPAGRLEEIEVRAEGFVPRTLDIQAPVAAEAGRAHRLVLSRACVVTGRVVDADERPVAQAAIRVATDDGTRDATADAGGRFRVGALPAGRVLLRAAPPGWWLPYGRSSVREGGDAVEAILEGEGSTANVTLTIGTGRTLRGRVVLANGAPVPDAVVTLRAGRYAHDTPYPLPPPATSAADGSFVFTGIDPLNHIVLLARVEGLTARAIPNTIWELAARDDLEIVLRPPATIAGRVVAPDGGALPSELLDRGDLAVWSGHGEDARYGVLDDRGGFVLRGLVAGRHHPHLSAGYGGPDVQSKSIAVDWGDRREGVTLRLVATGTTSGVVVDPRGDPIADVPLAFGGFTEGGRCTTAADGTFRVEGLPPGLHHVTFGDDDTIALRRVRAGDTGVRLVHEVPPLRYVAGRVLDPDGRAVPSAVVAVWGAGGEGPWSADLGSARVRDGSFRVTFRTSSERVTLAVENAHDGSGRPLGTRRGEWEVEVDREGLELRLEPGLVLAGQVVGEAGEPIGGATVTVGARALRTDADGRFRADGLSRSPFFLDVSPPPPYAPRENVLVEGDGDEVVVRLARTWRVQGRVLAPDGSSAQAVVQAHGLRCHVSATTDADGRFDLRGVHGDRVSVTLHLARADRERGRMPPPRARVTAESGEIVLRLRQGVFVEGILVDPAGDPVPHAEVRLRGEGRRYAKKRLVARDGGRFRIGPIDPGAWKLAARSRTDGLGDVKGVLTTAPSSRLRVVLPRIPVLRVRVHGDDLDGFHVAVSLRRDNMEWRNGSRALRPDGTLVFDVVDPEATYAFFAHRAEDDRYALATGIRPGEEEIVLRLTTGLDLGGRLDVASLDVPLVRASLDRHEDGPEIHASGADGVEVRAPVDLDGSFRFRGLPPGRYHLAFVEPTASPAGRDLVARGELADVEAGRRDVVVPVAITDR